MSILTHGVLFFSNQHLPLFEKLLNFYFENQQELDNWTLGGVKNKLY